MKIKIKYFILFLFYFKMSNEINYNYSLSGKEIQHLSFTAINTIFITMMK